MSTESKKSTSKSKPKSPELENLENPRKISSLMSNLPENSGCLLRLGSQTTFNARSIDQHSVFFRWVISNFAEVKSENMLHGPYTDVGGLYFRLGMTANAPCWSTPGYLSFFIQPDKARCSKLEYLAGLKVTLVNCLDDSQSLHFEWQCRYSGKENILVWKDFAALSTVLDPKIGFLSNQSVRMTGHFCILDETLTFSVDDGGEESVSSSSDDVYFGKYSWRIKNFSLFKERRITSPAFRIGSSDCRLTIDKSLINGVEYLSLFVESDIEYTKAIERQWIDARKTEPYRSWWGFFGIWILNQKSRLEEMHRKSTVRFSTRSLEKCCGWPGYMKMSDFIGSEKGFLVDDDTVVFGVSFHLIKESFYSKHGLGSPPLSAFSKCDKDIPTFYWEMQNFSCLKDIMVKKMNHIRIVSMVMQVQNQSFLLAVYPRGPFHKPSDLALVLESISPPSNSLDWSGLVHYGFGMMNHKASEKSSFKESLRRCCRDTSDVDYEFITLDGFVDENCGFINEDTAVFFAQIDILKETLTVEDWTEPAQIELIGKRKSYTWKVENFLDFHRVLANQEVYSKSFEVAEFQFRIGVFILYDSVLIYLYDDPSLANDADDNFWVSFRIGLLNQKSPTNSLWKKSALFTKTSRSYDFHAMKLSDILERDSGYVFDNMIVFVCEILDYSPWLNVLEPEVLGYDEAKVSSLSDSDKHLKSKDSELNVERKGDIFKKTLKSKDTELNVEREVDFSIDLISGAVFQLMHENNHPRPLVVLRVEFQLDVYVLVVILKLLDQRKELDSKSCLQPSVKAIRMRLEELGTAVSTCVLNPLSETIAIWDEMAETKLRQIYSLFNLYDPRERFSLVDEKLLADRQFSNISMLVDLLSLPSLAVEAAKAFEKGIAHGFIVVHLVTSVMEMHFAHNLEDNETYNVHKDQHKGVIKVKEEKSYYEENDFTVLVDLSEKLSVSNKPQVCEFVRMLYSTLCKHFVGEIHCKRLLRGFVDNAIILAHECQIQNRLDILLFLVHGESEIATMVANADRFALFHQPSAIRDEITCKTEEWQPEISSLKNKKAILLENSSESEASICHRQSEMVHQLDELTTEKKKILEHIKEVEAVLPQESRLPGLGDNKGNTI